MIGYLIEQELGNVLPPEKPIATILTMVQVDNNDTAFDNPTKFVGPVYTYDEARRLSASYGWEFRKDGSSLRRVVASPEPQRIFEIRPIRWLLDQGTVVICAGGGGIPAVWENSQERALKGVEAVVDKDLASGLLAKDLGADLFIMATDVDGVYVDWGGPNQHRIGDTTPAALRSLSFSAGSMGPKVEAAARFVTATGNRAAIGSLVDIEKMVDGTAGTIITPDEVKQKPARTDRVPAGRSVS
jgi:carbamate kinase